MKPDAASIGTPPDAPDDLTPEQRLKDMLRIAGLPEKPSYRPDEVAQILGCHYATVYRMMAEEVLPTFRLRGHPRVDWGALAHHIGQSHYKDW